MIDFDVPPILTPPKAVISFAAVNDVKLFANECKIKTSRFTKYKGYNGYKIYPCIAENDICIILYKNMRQIRFATQEELKIIY